MTVQILLGDCRDVLRSLPAESVHCVVTSPPYFGLRDYGTGTWEGGDPDCDHIAGMARQDTERETPGGRGGSFRGGTVQFAHECGKCGAQRVDRQIGLEASPDAFIATMVEVFREVRRVLRPDATCWVNLGDSYNNVGGLNGGGMLGEGRQKTVERKKPVKSWSDGYKPKDLMMIPARVALALQADGWWLRSDIIWSKPNPMPESVTDRPTSAHEHVFLLSKAARYYYDGDAIREEPSGRTDAIQSFGEHYGRTGKAPPKMDGMKGANKKNVWTIATAPFSEAHFATFPPALVEPCIKAGTSEKGCCPACGAPWVREVFVTAPDGRRVRCGGRHTYDDDGRPLMGDNQIDQGTRGSFNAKRGVLVKETTGWSPSCSCPPAAPTPCTVLDPFGGAGTTGLVADRLQRNAILIELNPDYAAMARRRLTADAPLLAAMG